MIEQTVPKEMLDVSATQMAVQDELLGKQNVCGVGVGNKITGGEDTGKKAIIVMVTHKVEPDMLDPEDQIKSKIKNRATDVVEVGDIFAGGGVPEDDEGASVDQEFGDFDVDEVAPQTLRQRLRPAMGGYSVGHYRITAGTIATCCYDITPFPGVPRKYYILSNNHVLANSNKARVGDPILQPGPYDGGRYPRDLIARLSRFVPIRFKKANSAPCNYVDAAIAEGEFHNLNREIYWVGYVKDMYVAPTVGLIVQKTGRTTNFTTGRVIAINATVDVNYGSGRVARFCRQIVTTNMSAGGDSGSLVTDRNEKAVGLLFAGSSAATIINNIAYVQSLLRIRIHEQ